MPTTVSAGFERTLALRGGRQLGYADAGAPDGPPLVLFHGTPSSRLDALWLDEPAQRAGWRLVAWDRPGHGLSSPRRDASILDHAADVEELADALGLDRFAVLGYSGGAPYALATAAVLADRVELVGLVSAWGPPDRPGAYAEVAVSERASDALARHAPAVTTAMFGALAMSLRVAPTTMARVLVSRLESGANGGTGDEPTSPLVPGPESMTPLVEAFRRGPSGPARDLHRIVSPWGFEPSEVTVPVRLWHGDHDPEIPMHHSEHLAGEVADGRLEVIEGGDHLALYHQADRILAELLAARPGG
jgi:pimeloyl-ACP methyl ester carboxylesterase